jgi:hypothetical protein
MSMIGLIPWMALTPSHDLALCARTPRTTTSARSVPWQPPSIAPSVGSMTTAKSPASQSGWSRVSRSSPFRSASISSQS